MPPTILLIGNVHMNQPYVFGQSGTDSPDPVLVTSPPAIINTAVHVATKVAKSGRSKLRRFERERDVLAFLRADGHGLRLRAEFLVPRLDRVRTGRQSLQREGTVGSCHRVIRMIENTDPGVHPAVDV